MSRGRRRRGGARRPAAGEGASSAATAGTESPSPQAGTRQAGTRKGGSRQKQTPQGGRQQAVTPPGTEGARRSGGRRRRRRSGASRAEPSVLEQMANRPRVLQTLPADGLVAEEIIGDMREEYGYPATPQEYRLIVRVAPDEAERQSARRRREPSALPEGPAEATDEEAVDG